MKAGVTINRPPRDGIWPSCARPTSIRSSCCRKAPPAAEGAMDLDAQYRELVSRRLTDSPALALVFIAI